MKADLHIHSKYSRGGISRPETILETAASRGVDIIGIVDQTTQSWHAFAEASKRYPVQVVYGQEFNLSSGRHSDGDLLALFLESPIRSSNVPAIIREISSQKGIASIAHPFCSRLGEFRAFDQIEDWSMVTIEARNGRTVKTRDNEMAEELANRLQLPVTAGSDALTPFEIGNVYLECDGRTVQDLKNAILHREVKIGGAASSVLFKLFSSMHHLGLFL